MKTISNIKTYRSNVEVFLTTGESFNIAFDGAEGIYTRSEFCEDNELSELSSEDQNRVLDAIESQYNIDFFLKENNGYQIDNDI